MNTQALLPLNLFVMSKTKKDQNNIRNLSIFEKICIFLLFSVGAISLCIYIGQLYTEGLADGPEEFAWFGDYIGGIIGSISALIGIVFLYRTYKIQLDISSCQERIQRRQQFEDTFFSLLGQQRSIITNIRGKIPIKKGQSFEEKMSYEYVSQLRHDLAEQLQTLNFEPNALAEGKTNILKLRVNEIYTDFFLAHAAQLGHYFRHLYHLLKFIQTEREIEKQKYSDLVQAQMSYDELYLIAINGISNYGRKKMLPLLNEFSFLENLAVDDDEIVRRLIELFYPSTKKKDMRHMKRNIIFVGGIHCVGKTTFSRKIKESIPLIETLSCSEVLKWENPSKKNVEDIESNQNRLIANLVEIIDIDKPYLLDGHFCLLDRNNNVERIGIDTFRDINPEMIILLTEDIDVIQKRLQERDNREYSIEILENFDSEETKYAREVAQLIGVSIHIIKASEYEKVIENIKAFVSSLD